MRPVILFAALLALGGCAELVALPIAAKIGLGVTVAVGAATIANQAVGTAVEIKELEK